MSALAAAAIVTALVGLPPGATAPPPGSIPPGARVQVLDRQLGIASVELRRRDAPRALLRLRRAPGVRYATVQQPSGGLASAAGCTYTGKQTEGSHPSAWRATIQLKKQSAAGFTVGIPDTGADLSRLGGARDRLEHENFTGSNGVSDSVNHGTEVASLIGANRPDLKILGVAPDVGLAIARIGRTNACDAGTIARNLIQAFNWFRQIGDVQIVNVSVYIPPNKALVESLRKLQQAGTLVVAATGNSANPGKNTFPAGEPHVLGVGALKTARTVWSLSGRGTQVDLVAPGGGMGVVNSSVGSPEQQVGSTTLATSFATPLVTGAAALVWAKHPAWDASRVAAALMMSAKHLSGARPNTTSGYGRLDVKAALRAIPPADLDEPNDWPSAARAPLHPLVHQQTVAATVGGSNDPLDAYPIATKGKSVVTITGAGALQAFLVRASSIGSIDDAHAKLQRASSTHASGRTVHLRVPGKGSWYVVVTALAASTPIGYSLRLP